MQLILMISMLNFSLWKHAGRNFVLDFITHRTKESLQSVIQSAREGTNVVGVFYQNDIASVHPIEKRTQFFKMGSVLESTPSRC